MKMNKNSLVYAISAGSVLLMFIWGWLEKTYAHSWLAILAGGFRFGKAVCPENRFAVPPQVRFFQIQICHMSS